MVVYGVRNKTNAKVYVGKTERTVAEHWLEHCQDAANGRNTAPLFHRAIRKYGAQQFTVEILEECTTREELDLAEIRWIATLHAVEKEHGYNLTLGGTGGKPNAETLAKLRKPKTELHKQRLSLAAAGRDDVSQMATADARQKAWKTRRERGHVCSEEARANMRKRPPVRWTDARRAKHSARMMGANNPSFGKAFPAPPMAGSNAARIWMQNNSETHLANCRKASKASWENLTEQEKQERVRPMQAARWAGREAGNDGTHAQSVESNQ